MDQKASAFASLDGQKNRGQIQARGKHKPLDGGRGAGGALAVLLSLSVPVAAVASLSLGDCRLSSITDNLSLGLPTEKNLWFVSLAFWLADRVRGAPSLQMLSKPGEPLTLVVACPGFRCASLHCRPISSLPRHLSFPLPLLCITLLEFSLLHDLFVT